MSIQLLLVEDNPTFLDTLRPVITALGTDINLRIVGSRDSAIIVLGKESFDLTILDLKIPTIDGALDANAEHGNFVLHKARELAPGTPILILTGSSAEGFIDSFLNHSEQVGIWGKQDKMPTIRFLPKSKLDQLSGFLDPIFSGVRAVQDIELHKEDHLELSWEEDRLIRIFVRRRGGVSCRVSSLSQGLSGAKVFLVAIYNATGIIHLNTVLKIGTREMVNKEWENYDQHAQRLIPGATPRLLEDVQFGGGRFAAISYSLAESYTKTAFDLLQEAPEHTESMIITAARLLERWQADIGQTRLTIADVRRRMLSDDKVQKLIADYGLDWISHFESRNVQVRWGCIHGDLHGGNLLVDADNTPVIIDYGDVGNGPAAMDWVVLELSCIFHPDGTARNSSWPSIQDCANWANPNLFSKDSLFAPFIMACRGVANNVAAGPREVSASAYSYLLRQLKYPDTNKDTILALLNSVRLHIETQT